MSNDHSNPAESTGQPFRLLDLPRELLVPIVRSYRSPVTYNNNGAVIYQGEINHERYRVLMDLCSTHRDILAFAQEELFKRLDIQSKERMDMLNASISSSERCKEFAGRADSIFLGMFVNADGLMQSGAFNPRELSTELAMKVSLLNRFRNLRRIHLTEAQLDEALVLPSLETYSVRRTKRINTDPSADFKSANLPNLRSLTIAHGVAEGTVGQLYDSILAQLDHLFLRVLDVTDSERLLSLSTSLQSLAIILKNYNEGLVKVLNQLNQMDVKKLVLFHLIRRQSSDNWETDFELLEEIKKLVKGKEALKQVALDIRFQYVQRPSEDVCDRALSRWKGIKGELESIFVKKGIAVGHLTCSLSHSKEKIWTA